MKLKRVTFHGGVRVPEHKELTEDKPIEVLPEPELAIIPLSQHTGKFANPTVKPGDRVRIGTKIGELQGFISANVHSSIAGKVVKIDEHPHPVGTTVPAVFIENDGSGETEEFTPKDWEALSPQEIIETIKEAGIVGLGGAAFPTHVKLSPPPEKRFHSMILNGAECEPYLTIDYRLMVEHTREILEGGAIIRKALGAKTAYIGIEDNKPEAIEQMMKLAPEYDFEVVVLRTKYPQGSEKQLIKAITGKEVPSGGLPMDVGVYVQNVGTAYAIYEVFSKGKPLYERGVTVTGKVKEPKNLLVRIGTPVKKLIEAAGGYSEPPGKLIIGGPMMGISQYTEDIPVVKGTTGIVVQSAAEVTLPLDLPCIRCGFCVDVCPMGLVPTLVADYVRVNDIDAAEEWGIMDCMECGSCAYVCPAKRNLVHYIKLGKTIIMKRRK